MQWVESFKSECSSFEEAQPTLRECEDILSLCDKVVAQVRIPLLIQNAVNARHADGSCLEYGLKYHLEQMENAVGESDCMPAP
jgi:hypothetical protein